VLEIVTCSQRQHKSFFHAQEEGTNHHWGSSVRNFESHLASQRLVQGYNPKLFSQWLVQQPIVPYIFRLLVMASLRIGKPNALANF
jgi:hypothetical protein